MIDLVEIDKSWSRGLNSCIVLIIAFGASDPAQME